MDRFAWYIHRFGIMVFQNKPSNRSRSASCQGQISGGPFLPKCSLHIRFYLSWIIKNHQTSTNNLQQILKKQQTKPQTCYTCICLAMLKFQKPIVPKAGTSNMCRKAKSMRIKFCWNHASSYSPQVANHRTTGTQQLNVQSTAASGLIPNQTHTYSSECCTVALSIPIFIHSSIYLLLAGHV